MARILDHDGVRRVLRTFLFAFLGLLIPGLLGWLNALTQWANSEGQAPFPDARSLAYIGVAAITAGFIAAFNAIWVMVEDFTGRGLLRNPPAYPPARERGAIQYGWPLILTVIAVIVVLALLL